ncbi:MAG: PpiC-type peptidyl-prolyl cis-trans isomerase [Symbiobacteriaceae bacterium]|nr:PpiC-type peptidyl-prolyl cis-trans isomerase [Symbiobacteriaceae bacterium]
MAKRFVAAVLMVMMLGAVLAGCGQPKLSEGTVAVVNGRTVTQDDLNTRVKIFELFFKQPMTDTASKQQVLDQMVRDRLIRDQATQAGVTVTDEQVEAEMGRFLGALENQYAGRDEVNKRLGELGLTNDQIATFLKDFLIGQGMVEKKKAEVQVTDDELRAFYEAKKDTLYTYTEDVTRAAHILVPLDQPDKAEEIAAKAESGGDFAELAKLYSVDPGTAKLGGDLGYFTRTDMVEEFAEAAFSIEPGETSDPVQTEFGWHIILVKDRRSAGLLDFDKAHDDLVNRVLAEKQEKAYDQWLAQLEQNARIQKATITG